ncbi:hypothetical protein V7111_23435 [Neobacillus niacini]|uniref:hypothetical protein n=1 Tax=Neobacillus niacini TaxID=86668 RepID=UPI00300360FC
MTKEFSNKNAAKSVIIGLAFVIIGLAGMAFSVPIGSAGFLLGIVLFFLIRYLSSDTTVICHDTGFTVKVVNKKKGNTIQEFRWE